MLTAKHAHRQTCSPPNMLTAKHAHRQTCSPPNMLTACGLYDP